MRFSAAQLEARVAVGSDCQDATFCVIGSVNVMFP
jgi:hypothetical protein